MVDLLLYLKCFPIRVAVTPPLQRGSRAEGSTQPQDLPSVPFQCRIPSMEGIPEPAHCRRSITAPQPHPRVRQSLQGSPNLSRKQGPELGWDEDGPDPRDCCQCSGGQDRQGTSPGAWGRGAALEMRGQESPGAPRGLGSIRGVLGRTGAWWRGIGQDGGWGSALRLTLLGTLPAPGQSFQGLAHGHRECSVTGVQSLFLGAQGFISLLLPAHRAGGATMEGGLCWLLLHRMHPPHH